VFARRLRSIEWTVLGKLGDLFGEWRESIRRHRTERAMWEQGGHLTDGEMHEFADTMDEDREHGDARPGHGGGGHVVHGHDGGPRGGP
jgi:hypothetical protein